MCAVELKKVQVSGQHTEKHAIFSSRRRSKANFLVGMASGGPQEHFEPLLGLIGLEMTELSHVEIHKSCGGGNRRIFNFSVAYRVVNSCLDI